MEIKQAITEIREIGLYGNQVHQETLETSLKALKKQMPKKVIREPSVWPDGQDRIKLFCPVCHDGISPDEKYCSECGQRLDWSENDG